jgi:3-methylfumaryl-CoA hydratase
MDEVRRTELITPGPAEALAGLLGVQGMDADGLAGLPLLWHWLYLLDRPAQAALGVDGHPAAGSIPSPPGPGRRRMFAGGRVQVLSPLSVGLPATRVSSVRSTKETTGRSGSLTFVTIGHEIIQGGCLVISEEQDIVYRDLEVGAAPAPTKGAALRPVAGGRDRDWVVPIDPVMLFRFSALTYNAHRIHYDRDYARDIEGYPGLLVHGPLQAILMAEAIRRMPTADGAGSPRPVDMTYRLIAPLFDDQGLAVSVRADGDGAETTVHDSRGRPTASARIRFAD